MVLFQISFQTFLKAFVVHGILFGTFLFFAYKVLKRDRKWLNSIISCFYISIAVGFFINFVFVLLSSPLYNHIVLILYYATMYFLLLGTFFLTIFTLILLKTENLFPRKKQIFFILLYGVLLVLMVLIPNGVTINASTNWNPVYNLYYYLYLLLMFSIFSVIPQLYYFFKINQVFSQEELKKRWKFFGIGMLFLYILAYGTLTYNFLDIDVVRLVFGFISLGCAIISAISIYYGIAKL